MANSVLPLEVVLVNIECLCKWIVGMAGILLALFQEHNEACGTNE